MIRIRMLNQTQTTLTKTDKRLLEFSGQKGSSLIEILIAIAVAGLVMTAIAITMMYSVQREAENRYKESAVSLAQTAIDLVLVQRAILRWDNFYTNYLGSKCLAPNLKELVGVGAGCPDIPFGGLGLATEVVVEPVIDPAFDPAFFDDRVLVTATVTWSPGSIEKNYTLSQTVYKTLY